MNLEKILKEKNITIYRLSKMSGVPKSTLFDICSNKSKIENCSGKTIYSIASALNVSMEEILNINTEEEFNIESLPEYLIKSIKEMESIWEVLDRGEKNYRWDAYWKELNVDINFAERSKDISKEVANYLRKKYLRLDDKDLN